MRKVTLVFKDIKDMRTFHAMLSGDYMEFNARTLTIVCECEEKEIKLATSAFNATVLENLPFIGD